MSIKQIGTQVCFLTLLLSFNIGNAAYAQQNISGIVTDGQSGETLPGVNISVKGTTTGTSTNSEGAYELTIPSLQDTLIFSFIGYQTQEVSVNGQTKINVTLKVQAISGEEMVVVGYGTQKKENLTGSVSSISSEALSDRPINSVGQALQGKIPNLNIGISSGQPGEEADFNIRGTTSINGGSPLVLVDGVQMNPNLINPENIKSVTVLKDAAASAIYGVRAAFGVILITTKSGKKDTPLKVNLSSDYSFNKPTIVTRQMESLPYANLINTAQQNANGTNYFDEETMNHIRAYYNDPLNNKSAFMHSGTSNGIYTYAGNTDWTSETFRNSFPKWQNTLTISGGSDNTSYYGSYGYTTQQGLFQHYNEKFHKHNIAFNIKSDVNKWLTIFGRTTFNIQNRDYPNQSVGTTQSFLTADMRPLVPVYNPDGHFGGKGQNGEFTNPIAVQALGGSQRYDLEDKWLTGGLKLNPIQEVVINFNYSYNLYSRNYKLYNREFGQYGIDGVYISPFPHTSPNGVRLTEEHNAYDALNLYGKYSKTFFKRHDLKLTIGFNQEEKHFKSNTLERENLINNNLPAINLANGEQVTDGTESSWAVRGAFFRFNYDFDNLYLLEINGRYDGTSRFSKNDRFVFYPSASFGWRLSGESFMKKFKPFLSNLKFRYSIGTIGNQNVSTYAYIPTMGSGELNYILNGQKPVYVQSAGLITPNLTWEKVTTNNFGVDFGFLSNKLTGSFDYYIRRTTDMLTAGQPLPSVLGTPVPEQNVADLKVKGWDLEMNWNNNYRNGSYSIGLVFSDHHGEITKFPNPNKLISNYYIGRKLGEIWGFKSGGLFQSEQEVVNSADQSAIWGGDWAPGDMRYADLSDDGKITRGDNTVDNPGDQLIIGNTTPRYSFGITGNMNWKGFNVSIFLQGVLKRDINVGGYNPWFFGLNGNQYSVPRDFNSDYWTPENKDAYFFRPNLNNRYGNSQIQTQYLQDGKYIRLKNLTLGYTIPNRLVKQLNLSKIKIYFSGENIWEATAIKFNAFDPEIQDGNIYPLQRSYAFGIDISI